MKLKPMHDWAVIVPSEAEARTAGGLFIPETAKEKPEEGVVEAIGPGAFEEEKHGKKKEEKKERKFIPTTVKPGDRVLFERYAGQTYKVGDAERILVRERDILGLLERPARIPAVTSSPSATAIMERPVAAPVMKRPEGALAVPIGKRTAEKSVKKTAKAKAKKKTVKKVAKKTAKKSVKKAAKKTAPKPAKAAKGKKKTAKKK